MLQGTFVVLLVYPVINVIRAVYYIFKRYKNLIFGKILHIVHTKPLSAWSFGKVKIFGFWLLSSESNQIRFNFKYKPVGVNYWAILSTLSFLTNMPRQNLLLNSTFSFYYYKNHKSSLIERNMSTRVQEEEKKIVKDKPFPRTCTWGNLCDVVCLVLPEGSHCVPLEFTQPASWHFEQNHDSITPTPLFICCVHLATERR